MSTEINPGTGAEIQKIRTQAKRLSGRRALRSHGGAP